MKYYLALRFRGRPDLHMTVNYYSELSSEAIDLLRIAVDEEIRVHRQSAFSLTLDKVVWVGPRNSLRALRPSTELPSWVSVFAQRSWYPHVTTWEKSLTLVVDAMAIMCEKEETCRWELR